MPRLPRWGMVEAGPTIDGSSREIIDRSIRTVALRGAVGALRRVADGKPA